MIPWVLRATLPGGIPLLEALGIGLAVGLDPALQSATVLQIDDTGNPLKPKVAIAPRTTGGLLTQQETAQLGLRQAKMFPHAAASLVSSTPTLAYALYKPIRDLGNYVTPFRRAGVPQVTGLEGLPSLAELIADAKAGAKVASAVMPPPWEPKSSLAGATVAGLIGGLDQIGDFFQQLWGLLNGRGKTERPGEWSEVTTDEITLAAPATIVVNVQATYVYTYEWCPGHSLAGTGGGSTSVYTGSVTRSNVKSFSMSVKNVGDFTNPCGGSAVYPSPSFAINSVNAAGTVTLGGFQPLGPGNSASPNRSSGNLFTISITSVTADGAPLSAPPQLITGGPGPVPYTYSEAAAAPTVQPPAPLILPLQPSAVPEAAPVTQPDVEGDRARAPVTPFPITATGTRTGRTSLPALPAYTPPLRQPAPAQPITQTRPDGSLVPTTAPPVVATDPGSIIPWPGAAPIPGRGPAPAPTLQGIAQEVGRIERKLEVMNNPNAPGNLIDKFDGLEDFIRPLIEAVISASSGTTYKLDSPCEVDAEGVKLPPVEIQAPGALTELGVIINRIDALAELLQVHKNLKQPNCRQKPPVGEFVTVNFEEI